MSYFFLYVTFWSGFFRFLLRKRIGIPHLLSDFLFQGLVSCRIPFNIWRFTSQPFFGIILNRVAGFTFIFFGFKIINIKDGFAFMKERIL